MDSLSKIIISYHRLQIYLNESNSEIAFTNLIFCYIKLSFDEVLIDLIFWFVNIFASLN